MDKVGKTGSFLEIAGDSLVKDEKKPEGAPPGKERESQRKKDGITDEKEIPFEVLRTTGNLFQGDRSQKGEN